MRYLRLLGGLASLVIGFSALGEFGCSASSDIKKPPSSTSSSGGHVAYTLGGATSQDTSAGGTSAGTGGVFVATGGAVACTETETRCSGACYDLASSHDHCGNCDTACGATEVCLDGVCGCPVSNPDADAGPITDYQSCGSICADLQSSKTNCGVCNKVCGFQRCIKGKCGCAETDIVCGTNKECFDPLTEHDHCGDCNTVCGKFDECVQGECVQNCAKFGTKECGGTCVDVTNNSKVGPSGVVENCGDCGISCPSDRFECKNAQCVCSATAVLPTVIHCVDPGTQKDLCVDSATDRRFCGSCAVACDLGKSCENSKCVCSATALQCSDGCYDGTSDSKHCGDCNTACGVGYHCASSACVCNEGLNRCGNRCADYNTEPANCGGCGQACGVGQACTAGKCQCDAGLELCSGQCFDLTKDAKHCGSCTTACSAAQSCIGSKCACGDNLTACGQDCVDAQNDALNCGACGTKCGGTQMCQGGTCRTSILKAQSQSAGDGGSVLRFSLALCNTSASQVNLNGYTLKYWYTADGAATTQVPVIAYAPPPFTTGTNPAAKAELLPIKGFRECTTSTGGIQTCKADAVLTLTFATANLAANACTQAVQLEIHPDGWAGSYDKQTTDYSYIVATALKDNQYITIYNAQGLIVWGLEPAPPPT